MSKISILIVDDEVGFTTGMKLNLEATGEFDVHVLNSSANVVTHALEIRPDLIVLDIVMPGHDGGDVKRELQAWPTLKDIPIIFVTAMVSIDETASEPFVHSGKDIMIPKPVTTKVLIQCIEDRLAGRI